MISLAAILSFFTISCNILVSSLDLASSFSPFKKPNSASTSRFQRDLGTNTMVVWDLNQEFLNLRTFLSVNVYDA